jgi:hypothetical protein
VWLIDFGASFHMTSHQHYFSMYVKYDGGMVYLSDEFPLRIVCFNRVLIRFPHGRVKGINGVFHILGLAWNLLSIRKLNDVSVKIVLIDKGCKIVKEDMVFAKGVLVLCTVCKALSLSYL